MTPAIPDTLTGRHGVAHRIPTARYREEHRATLDAWIITAERWHPNWSQYLLCALSLADIEGAPPAKKRTPDVTHELLVVVLNPDHGPYDARLVRPDHLQHLTPVNVAEQFTATDDQARRIARLCTREVVDGRLTPETGDAPDHVRAWWHITIREALNNPRRD
ncbi:hypothetical protein [Streptomyces stelliscabiei]|uniref:hypothetical protein n=1 Tax=Streptomyces stelliscabiei TaxID=146820 RepID=UPI0029B3298F|nr:hypothetical protein [Streptomyces stelliscabiei]MDX2551345.1 hypothetical protein [Streptomyces stelliscabiei]